MKYFIFSLLSLVSFSTLAVAADQTDGISSGIAVQSILCNRAHLAPSNDVAYKPGVDVNGNPVTPADGGAVIPMQSHYTEVPLNIDLANKLNINRPSEAELNVASIRIYDDGRVLYNGQDISQQTTALCGGQPVPSTTMAPAQNVTTMPSPDVPLPGSAAPSSTTPAR